jgi:hypothetical protein
MFDKDRFPDVVPREIRCSVFEDRLHALREAYDGVGEDDVQEQIRAFVHSHDGLLLGLSKIEFRISFETAFLST